MTTCAPSASSRNLPSFTDLYGPGPVEQLSGDLYDLSAASTPHDVSMSLVANQAGENCLGMASTRSITGKRPGNYLSVAYSDMELLGTGMASGKQYALDTGTSILVSSFGDSNSIIARSGETGEVVSTAEVQNQGVAKLSGITSGDSVETTGGCQGIRAAILCLCAAHFSGNDTCCPIFVGGETCISQ